MKKYSASSGTHALDQSAQEQNQRNTRRILRIGHRGAAGHAPENTIAAIRAGISLDVDFVELDVQRTRDGRLVVVHDNTLDRTTSGAGSVCEMRWDELQLLDAGNGERVPSVETALAAASGRAGVILEAKAPGIGPDLFHAVNESAFSGSVIYASFLHAEILAIRRIDPQAKTMFLIDTVPVSGASFARESNATLVGVPLRSASAESIAALHRAGSDVLFYTLNEPSQIALAIDLGVDGIISDYPERVPKIWPR
jgi:glycerophosphoryl diester phosphodiesterase